jgi:hypothetical protein
MKKNYSDLLFAASMASIMGWGNYADPNLIKAMTPYVVKKPLRKCLLSGCDIKTKHNGGYCCGDHCREHDRIKKGG